MSLKPVFHKQFLMPAVIAALVFAAFWLGVFFRGFDQVLFAPALLLVSLAGFLLLLPGLRAGWQAAQPPLPDDGEIQPPESERDRGLYPVRRMAGKGRGLCNSRGRSRIYPLYRRVVFDRGRPISL